MGLRRNVVVVVDDDPDIADFLAGLLSDEGYNASIWRSGTGALAFIKEQKPMAVVLDVRMETPDAGLKVAEALAADQETSAIPVIVCSGESEFVRTNRRRLEGLSFQIVDKPFSIPRLLAILNNATLRQRYSAATD